MKSRRVCMLDRNPMLKLLVLLTVSALACGADVDLAVGRPSLQSRAVSVSSQCPSVTNLNVDANVTGLGNSDCSCTITNGTWPPATRDWHFIQLASQSLVRSVRVSGHASSLEVLVGDEFDSNPDVNSFSLCTGYNPSDNGRLLTCTSPIIGSVVALRAMDNDASLRLCRIEVMGLSGNLLRAISNVTASLNVVVNEEQQMLLMDDDESTCIATAPSWTASNVTLKLSVPYRVNDTLRVKIILKDVSLPNISLNTSPDTSTKGRVCSLARTGSSPPSMELVCPCPTGCRGKLSVVLGNIPAGQSWNICEVIVVAPETADMNTPGECQSPMGPLGLEAGDGRFDDSAWTSSGTSSCAPAARLNYAGVNAGDYQAWCSSTATVGSWVAVNLGTLFKVRAILVQGSGASPGSQAGSYVTAFNVSYALGSAQWVDYMEKGSATLVGPSHATTPVLRSFEPEFMATQVRVEVVQWVGSYPCLRMELIGCRLIADEWRANWTQAISGATGIPNSALTASSEFYVNFPVERSRLGSLFLCNWIEIWTPAVNDANQWMQIDLGAIRTVQGMFWRGRTVYNQYVVSFLLQSRCFSVDAWSSYSAAPLPTGLTGDSTVYQHLILPIDARFVRINPVAYHSYMSIRLDLALSPSTPFLVSSKLGQCDDGYQSVSGYGCYRYVDEAMNYTEAERFCSNDGAHLARITDYQEWNTVLAAIPRMNSTALNRERMTNAQPWQYMGCYVDSSPRDLSGVYQFDSKTTTEHCAQFCLETGEYKYFGTEAGDNCFCGNRLGLYGKAAETDCSFNCVGNSSQKCGGGWRLSAFSFARTWSANPHAEWRQRGCFHKNDTRAFSESTTLATAMSVESCFDYCTTQGLYKFMALQGNSKCLCGNSFNASLPRNQSECSTACGGDPVEMCGGSMTSSVYEITYLGASCVWIGGHSSTGNTSFRLSPTGSSLDVWEADFPVNDVNSTAPRGLCLDQKANYSVSAIPDAEKRHFLCEKEMATDVTPVGVWPLTSFHGLRDISSNRQHLRVGSGVTVGSGNYIDQEHNVQYMNDYAYFDGTVNAYADVQLRESTALSTSFTLLFHSVFTTNGLVLGFIGNDSIKFVKMSYQGSLLVVDLPRSRDNVVYSLSGNLPYNGYNVIAVTYSSKNGIGKAYLNGALLDSVSVGEGESVQVSSQLRLGYYAPYSSTILRGSIRCLQLFARVLQSYEMTNSLRRCNPSASQGLLGVWPFHGDGSNVLHRGHSASLASVRFTAGPRYRKSVRLLALSTDSTAPLSVAGPLNVNGSFTVLLHAKVSNASKGTLLSFKANGTSTMQVNVNGSKTVLVVNSSTSASGQCLLEEQWTQVSLRVDVTSSRLSLLCNSSTALSLSLTASQLRGTKEWDSMDLGLGLSLSVSCLILFERALTDLEISTYLFYCPYRPEDTFGKRSVPRRHCGEWRRSGITQSGLYIIDPDGTDGPVDPFTVFCNMTDSNDQSQAATLVRHSISDHTRVTGGAGLLTVPFPVSYEASMEQMLALMAVSAHCRQMLTYQCSGSAIYSGTSQVAGWYSRQNNLQPGWAGVPSGTTGCACSRQGKCAGGPAAKCNCDSNDVVWRSDSGWISDMDLLPVSKVALGDAATGGGYLTLGNLTCYG